MDRERKLVDLLFPGPHYTRRELTREEARGCGDVWERQEATLGEHLAQGTPPRDMAAIRAAVAALEDVCHTINPNCPLPLEPITDPNPEPTFRDGPREPPPTLMPHERAQHNAHVWLRQAEQALANGQAEYALRCAWHAGRMIERFWREIHRAAASQEYGRLRKLIESFGPKRLRNFERGREVVNAIAAEKRRRRKAGERLKGHVQAVMEAKRIEFSERDRLPIVKTEDGKVSGGYSLSHVRDCRRAYKEACAENDRA